MMGPAQATASSATSATVAYRAVCVTREVLLFTKKAPLLRRGFRLRSATLFSGVRGRVILGTSLTVVGRSTDEAPQAARRDAPPLQRFLCLHSLADSGLLLGPAI